MLEVKYLRCRSVDEALRVKARYGPKCIFVAGGTDVLVQARANEERYRNKILCDISRIGEMKDIKVDGVKDGVFSVTIGSGVTHSQIESSEELRRIAPLLYHAVKTIGSPQIRSIGTIGGNICNGSPSADSVPALMAYRGRLVVASMGGEREIALEEFFISPYRTVLGDNEILRWIKISCPQDHFSKFVKLGRREALSIARVNIAITIEPESGGFVKEATICAGAVGPVASRFSEIEQFLKGKRLNEDVAQQAGQMMGNEVVRAGGVRWSTPYKKPVVQALLKRALLEIGKDMGGKE